MYSECLLHFASESVTETLLYNEVITRLMNMNLPYEVSIFDCL